jgi:DNA-binding Lrp family transcriptional regulator
MSDKSTEQNHLLLDTLRVHNKLTIKEISKLLNISESSVRRLVAKMEQEKLVMRSHTGVQLALSAQEWPNLSEVSNIKNAEAKQAIATYACRFIENDDIILYGLRLHSHTAGNRHQDKYCRQKNKGPAHRHHARLQYWACSTGCAR